MSDSSELEGNVQVGEVPESVLESCLSTCDRSLSVAHDIRQSHLVGTDEHCARQQRVKRDLLLLSCTIVENDVGTPGSGALVGIHVEVPVADIVHQLLRENQMHELCRQIAKVCCRHDVRYLNSHS